MTIRGLVHAHSALSFDSLLPPRAYLAWAHRAGLDFLCLTDHNTIAGSLELARRNRDPRLEIVIGAEYATELGDLIGLFLREEIDERRWDDVVAAIRDQGGVTLLPQPHRGQRLEDLNWKDVDLVEALNARSTPAQNEASLRDAQERGLPQVCGSDGHTVWELLRAGNFVSLDGEGDLRSRLLTAERSLETRTSSVNLTRYSRYVRRVRRRLGFTGRAQL